MRIMRLLTILIMLFSILGCSKEEGNQQFTKDTEDLLVTLNEQMKKGKNGDLNDEKSNQYTLKYFADTTLSSRQKKALIAVADMGVIIAKYRLVPDSSTALQSQLLKDFQSKDKLVRENMK